MRNRLGFCALGIVLLAALSWNGWAYAQGEPASDRQASELPAPLPADTTESIATPCVPQPPLVRLQDYNGPLKKTVGLFSRKLELKAVHPSYGQPAVTVCSLHLSDKFILFVRDTFEPVTFAAAGFNAGIDQAANQDPSFGQGASGYGKRFGANFTDQASFLFFKDFAYPAIFSEDPRYYRPDPRQRWKAAAPCGGPCIRSSPRQWRGNVQCFGVARDGERGRIKQRLPSR